MDTVIIDDKEDIYYKAVGGGGGCGNIKGIDGYVKKGGSSGGISSYNNENIELKIQDNGKGFSNTILNRLGDPYVSSRSSSIQKDDKGSGLGLGFFISKTLLERLGIRINAYNKPLPETGAIVSVIIPTDKRI